MDAKPQSRSMRPAEQSASECASRLSAPYRVVVDLRDRFVAIDRHGSEVYELVRRASARRLASWRRSRFSPTRSARLLCADRPPAPQAPFHLGAAGVAGSAIYRVGPPAVERRAVGHVCISGLWTDEQGEARAPHWRALVLLVQRPERSRVRQHDDHVREYRDRPINTQMAATAAAVQKLNRTAPASFYIDVTASVEGSTFGSAAPPNFQTARS